MSMFLHMVMLSALFSNIVARHLVEVVMAVQGHFRSGCVYLLCEQNGAAAIVNDLKSFGREGVQTTAVFKGSDVTECQHNRPLFVLRTAEGRNTTLLTSFLNSTRPSGAIWLLFVDKNSHLKIFTDIISIPFDCEFLVARHEDGHSVVLTEVYHVSPSLPLQTHHFGNWTSSGGLTWPTASFYERRNNFHGHLFRTICDEKLLKDTAQGNGGKDYFFYQVWAILSKIMNFTIEYKSVDISGNGVMLDNGSWNGIVGILQRGEADATIESLTMTSSRWQAVALLSPLWLDRKYMITKAATAFEIRWTSFLSPFDCSLWAALLATMLLLSASLGIVHQVCCHCRQSSSNGLLQSICKSSFLIFSAFCGQGETLGFTSASINMMCVTTQLLVLVLLASYSASLISYLTVRRPRLPFNTFSEFLQDGSFGLGVHRFSSLRSFFEVAEDPIIHQLYMRHIAPHKDSLPVSHLEGCRRVCSWHRYVYIHFVEFFQKRRNELKCELTIVPGAFITVAKSIALVRDSPYVGLFRHSLNKLRRNGMLQVLYATKPRNQVQETLFVSLDMTSLALVFTVLAVGMVSAALCLILELMFFYWRKHTRNKDSLVNGWSP